MERKYEVLKQYFGYTEFRSGQEALVDGILAGRDVLGIMPTGSGKSLCYQIPAIVMAGVTLVISPLISLMKDQVSALISAGIPAAYINSSLTPDQIRTAYKRCRMGRYKIIYVAPERLQTYDFLSVVRDLKIDMIAVDEAHCISQWGQDFRPSYLKIVEFLDCLPARPVVSAFTATATEKVAADIAQILKLRDPVRLVTGFDRPNLRFEVRRPAQKPQALQEILEEHPGKSGIIYCATRKETEAVWELLRQRGVAAARYHAGLSEEERHRNQDAFIYDACPVMVATNAFGMGIDKSNVSFVVHYNMPKCIEAYYQEAGRGGRDGTPADCILLYSPKDVQTARFLIQSPSENPDLSWEQQETILRQDFERLDRMVRYCTTTRCLRGFILGYFGQKHEETCGNCSSCTGDFTEQDITREASLILDCLEQIHRRLGYFVGENLVIQTLRGSRARRVHDLGLTELPSYAALSGLSDRDVGERIEALREQDLVQTNYQFSTLERTREDRPAEVTMRVRGHRGPAMIRQVQEDSGLLEKLKTLRNRLAQQERVPAYIIFSNATLQDMARKQPRTPEEFLGVSGVGDCKARRYGEAFLEEIRSWTGGAAQ